MNNFVNQSYAETAVRCPERRAMKFTVLPLTGHPQCRLAGGANFDNVNRETLLLSFRSSS